MRPDQYGLIAADQREQEGGQPQASAGAFSTTTVTGTTSEEASPVALLLEPTNWSREDILFATAVLQGVVALLLVYDIMS